MNFKALRKQNNNLIGGLLKTLFALSIPTMLEEVLSTLLQYADTAMVGRLGENATAAVSVTSTIGWLVGSFIYSAGTGILSLLSKAYGANDKRSAAELSYLAKKLSLWVGIIIGAVSLALSPFIPSWMGAADNIKNEASIYFAIISIPMVFRSASAILGSAVRATQNTKGPMLISLFSNVINIILDYILIYPAALGVTGAAIATAISFTIGGILNILLFRKTDFLKGSQKTSPELIKEFTSVAMPVVLTGTASCLGYVVFAALVSRMGTTIFAAHSIAVSAETIFYIPGYGLRTATAALIGASIGEKNTFKLKHYSILSVVITVSLMCLTGLLLFFTAQPLMSLFTPSEKVISLGTECLKLVALSEPFFGLMVVMEGIYYGTGKTRWSFVVETLSMWGVRILISAVGIFELSFTLKEVWYCMIADNIIKALLLALPTLVGKGPLKGVVKCTDGTPVS